MNIYYLSHSSFLIKTQNGKRILTDPFKSNDLFSDVDLITVSHNHFDHSNLDFFSKETKILQSDIQYENKFCKITSFKTFHDDLFGLKRGTNLIFKFEIDNITLCHLGDLGHNLNDDIISKLSFINVLFVPIGENYTLNFDDLKKVINKISPNFIVPMHYKVKGIDFSLNYLDKFLKKFNSFKKIQLDSLMISDKDIISNKNTIIILTPYVNNLTKST